MTSSGIMDGMPFFGYHMPSFTFPGVSPEQLFDHVGGLARSAESAGFELVTVMDHFYQITGIGKEEEPMLEGYTTLGALARETSRVRLATLVTGVTYRNPALVAKMITTLDVISKGRMICGMGAAWNESEHIGYGIPFPPIRERMDRLDEALNIIKLMFTQERPSFSGTHYRIDRALNVPRPVQPGGPKILVGGGGEKRTLRLVARYADMSHWFGPLADIKRKSEILDRYCDEEGRDPATITRTMGWSVAARRGSRRFCCMAGPAVAAPLASDAGSTLRPTASSSSTSAAAGAAHRRSAIRRPTYRPTRPTT